MYFACTPPDCTSPSHINRTEQPNPRPSTASTIELTTTPSTKLSHAMTPIFCQMSISHDMRRCPGLLSHSGRAPQALRHHNAHNRARSSLEFKQEISCSSSDNDILECNVRILLQPTATAHVCFPFELQLVTHIRRSISLT